MNDTLTDAINRFNPDFVPRALLSDMDGTLYDSMPRHAQAWKMLADEIGIHAAVSEFFAYEGRTGASTLNILFQRAYGRDATQDEVERLYRRKTELFKYFQSTEGIAVMPGAQQIVAEARDAGLRTVLVTGSGQGSLISRLDTDYPEAFPAGRRITARSVSHGKPHPEPFLRAAALAGFDSSCCIALENAPLGVESAHKSGAFTVAVCTGPIPPSDLADAGADIVFASMPECAAAFSPYFKTLI